MLKYIDSIEEFRSLLDYYITCLEKEDMSSLRFNYRLEGKKFFSRFFKKERFFIEKKEQVVIRETPEIENFLEDRKLESNSAPLFYGYPLIVDSNGLVKPLFFVEILLEDRDGTMIVTKGSIKPEFNHYVLNKEKYSIEEIEKICSEIAEEDTFMIKLDKIAKLLKLDNEGVNVDLEQKPIVVRQDTQLVNKAIIYFGERGGYTRSLLKELEKLKEEKSAELKSTSLGAFFNNSKKTLLRNNKDFLEVFYSNESQERAIENSFSRDINVITGPPGTGKSQVVLNIIANAVRNDKTVLFASRNNQAVDVVNEKLKSILSENLVVRMGNSFYRRSAVLQMGDLFKRKEAIKIDINIEGKEQKIKELNEKINLLRLELEEMSKINDEIEEFKNKIDELAKDIHPGFYRLYNGSKFGEVDKFELESDIKNNFGELNFIRRLIKKIMNLLNKNIEHKIFRKHVSKLNKILQSYLAKNIDLKTEEIEESLNWILNLKKIELLEQDLLNLNRKLAKYPSIYSIHSKIGELAEERIKISRKIFENYWLEKLKKTTPSDENHITRYVDISEKLDNGAGADKFLIWELIKEREKEIEFVLPFFPIWTVTNLSVRNSLPLKENLFDLLVIDEASQCDIASVLPLMFRARQAVIIGDPKQLSHISTLKESQDKEIASKNNIKNLYTDYSFKNNSIYDISERITKEKGILPTFLDEHYRSHPHIINFSNLQFYNEQLKIMTDENKLLFNKRHPKGVSWRNVKGKTIRVKSSYNDDEVKEIIKILESFSKADLKRMSFGVVTIFRAQMERIKSRIKQSRKLEDADITVGTCHRFQGDEKDIIFFSPAVAKGIKLLTVDWINKYLNMTNVAITRAKSHFIVVGDIEECKKTGGILKTLAEYVESNKKPQIRFDSTIEEKFYKKMISEGIKVVPQHEVCVQDVKHYRLDFAYFVNGNKYDIEIDGDRAHSQKAESDSLRDIHLRMDGWKVRRFRAKEVSRNISGVVEKIKRLC